MLSKEQREAAERGERLESQSVVLRPANRLGGRIEGDRYRGRPIAGDPEPEKPYDELSGIIAYEQGDLDEDEVIELKVPPWRKAE